ncbi:CusA/CzcA family heavy metal efflux RND transporter [Aliiglaciecola sp. CAU 1673]|uniref:efflux RND transporter permease subunit n=1 Tax=Aliiglaciecola sp. CAU 1673 TaxID=3032595 RepID=UPI0023DB8F12|nr:CusA/CzcA family heavy metal efflux RND transporter [Aliiglaciecola sp. CAU 1673]MDF2179526.1 CusA/CzcA family heavy metal efflux RND transporter [Aliiglaciecola sp. CAU 1673]
MIANLIDWSVRQRALVLIFSLLLLFGGWQAMQKLNLDAIPDLSDVQVIIKTAYPGQSPQVVEQQVTYPLANIMMAVPGARTVRGFSFFGDSFLYVLFEDGTDLYWARSRVLEYLNQAQSRLPANVQPTLGPDASGVGWVFQYALKDTSGNWHLADLKSLQDWFLKQELQAVPGVAEVATVGGMTRTYQVLPDPLKLARYRLGIEQIRMAILANNGETGGATLEMGEGEYMLRARGYLQSLADFEHIPLGVRNPDGIPLLLKDVAEVRLGPELRRGIAELDGQGEVVGGIVVMRSGDNARQVIEQVKAKLEALKPSLPEGVEVVVTYDRAAFIEQAVDNLNEKLLLEMLMVSVVLMLFLWHLGSAMVAVLILPLSLAFSFIVMQWLGISANIMSLGGIAIAIGALVDAAIVMVENLHKHLEHFQSQQGRRPSPVEHWQLVANACTQVGPALFLTLLIITISFLPVLVLEGQEGRLFAPMALTKSFAMLGAALLAITLVPVLMGYWVRGGIRPEEENPLSKLLRKGYEPLLSLALRFPRSALVFAALVLLSGLYPLKHLGSEFMPTIDEGDLLYMPTTLPGLSAGKAAQLLQQTDRLIAQVPEVERVFGKIGRAETATDPAPLVMLETSIKLKPKEQWRDGMTVEKLIAELDAKVQFPGVTNAWVQPIKTRIDMLSTGIKTPLGIKISGPDLKEIERLGSEVESILSKLPGTRSVFAERAAAGRYLDIAPDMQALARYGLSLAQLQDIIRYAIGGEAIGEVIDGNERYPINIRFERHWREDLEALKNLPVTNSDGLYVPLSSLATLSVQEGPDMIKSENARRVGWVFVDIDGMAMGDYLQTAQQALAETLNLPPKYSLSWSGQYEAMQRVADKLSMLIPLTLLLSLVLLYITLKRWSQSMVILCTLPIALTGSLWLLWYLHFNLSVAVMVGMVALAGVAAEFGVVMYLYLNQAWQEVTHRDQHSLQAAVIAGAVKRIRPKAMTVTTILASLLPIMFSLGAGHEVMQRVATPMLGGMILAPLVSLFLIPVAFYLVERRALA